MLIIKMIIPIKMARITAVTTANLPLIYIMLLFPPFAKSEEIAINNIENKLMIRFIISYKDFML